MIPYALPFRKPYVTARGSLDRRQIVLLRIRCEDGLTGLGEGVPMSLRGGDSLDVVVGDLENWGARALAGEQGLAGMCPPARIAAATALADSESARLGVPLHELLRPGAAPVAIECNATLTAGTPAEVLRQAEAWAGDGFTVFKLKLGAGDDLGQVEAVRKGLGETVKIRIDPNEAWPEAEAGARLAALEPFGIEFAEQPVAGLAAMSELRLVSGVPLVADESVGSAEQASEAARLDACDAVTVKLSKTGSLDATLGEHLPTYLSSALDGPVGIAAAIHAARALPDGGAWSDTAHGLATQRLFETTIASSGPVLEGPWLDLPTGPGLGVDIDEAALGRHRL